MHFTELIDLASERLGGAALIASDEFFAPKENLLKDSRPVFLEGRYTERGKWMDGWETRRRRTPGHDWCILRLGLPGVIHGVVVDTSHFKANYPEYCSIDGCALPQEPDPEQLPNAPWIQILPKSPLDGDTENLFPIDHPNRCTHLRLNIDPDGGVARLRVYGEVVPDWTRLGQAGEIDLAASENGGLVLASSDMYFGSSQSLIMPGPALNMADGWETRRRRGPGHDWVIIRLAAAGQIRRVEVDTSHFKGNYPESCSLEAGDGREWSEVLPRTRLQADTRHFFEEEFRQTGPVTHVRFNIFPDGGVSRLRIIGTVANPRLQRLNALSREEFEREMLPCCGSSQWLRRMAEQRPFQDLDQLLAAADRIWWQLTPQAWLEAFSQHPRIGESAANCWSQDEQSGTRQASPDTLAALLEANRAYEDKFGYIFIVRAAGKSADEMLAVLQKRWQNDPDAELWFAAEEQRQIMRLRLEKLLAS